MNNVVLIGRLTRDPELKKLQTGTSICNFTLAVDRGLSRDKKTEAEQKGYWNFSSDSGEYLINLNNVTEIVSEEVE